MNASLINKCIVVATAAVVSLSFTSSPSVAIVPVAATWEAVVADQQAPQGPAKKKVEDDGPVLIGTDDFAQSSWPGLASVGGLATLSDSPMSNSGGGIDGPGGSAGSGGMASPKVPQAPWTPNGRLLPPAPTAPLSPFMP